MSHTFLDAKNQLKNLLCYPTVEMPADGNYPFGKPLADCLDYALSLMSKEGFTTKNLDYYCGYGEIGDGELFGILCHLDVVPAGEGWTEPPFSAIEKDNRIYARGALDDKSPFIGTLFAVLRLLDEGYKPTKRIRFILGCDEESGWQCMDRYTKTEEMPALGISPDGDFPVINCEKGIVYHTIAHDIPCCVLDINGGERANMVPDSAYCILQNTKDVIKALDDKNVEYSIYGDAVTVATTGHSAHGSHPENGDNAILKLLKNLDFIPEFAEIYHAFSVFNGKNIGLNLIDEISGGLTQNLGTVKIANNKIIYELDIRHPITVTKDEITDILQRNLPFSVEQGFFHLPLYVDKEHILVKTLLNAYNTVMGTKAIPITIGGGTYARVLPLGVAFGPCFPDSKAGIHCVDEYVDLEEWQKSIDIYYAALRDLCFQK